MRGILQINKSFSGKLTAFMAFSFFVSGCHTGNESGPAPQVTVKKEAANYSQAKRPQTEGIVKKHEKIPETPVNSSASGILLHEKQEDKNRFCDPATDGKNPDSASRHDPFALPEALRKQQPVTQGKECFTPGRNLFEKPLKRTAEQQPAVSPAPGSQEPRVAGIFDNGKEKLALLYWQQVQGTFRCGEPLGNGYYVKEITVATVLLYPENSNAGIKPVTLTLQQ